jgi:hypothetical protein
MIHERRKRGWREAQLRAAITRGGALALLLLTAACAGQSGAEGTSNPGPNVPTPGLPGAGSDCADPDVEALTFDPSEDGDFDTLELIAGFGPEAVSGNVSLASVALRNPPPSLETEGALESLGNAECWGISYPDDGNASSATGTLE